MGGHYAHAFRCARVELTNARIRAMGQDVAEGQEGALAG